MAVINGYFKYQWVTEDLIIEGKTQGKYVIEASCTTPGLHRHQDGYRNELVQPKKFPSLSFSGM